MNIIKTKQELKTFVNNIRQQNQIIGFVPTMGALHKGHLSLIDCSLKSTDITISSIFVNPTQFNNSDDLKNYPRVIEDDIAMLESVGCHAVFIPSDIEMYPEKDTRVFDFDGIDTVMEGEHRPGHFNGVAQIVSKLFDAVEPHKAFFGQKDFQQVAIIKKMTSKLNYNIDIIACPIVRESDGLAMSSRNKLLTEEHRKISPFIYKVLKEAQAKFKGVTDVVEIKSWINSKFDEISILKLEYFEIVYESSLKPCKQISDKDIFIGCIAVWAGSVRLIDNIIFNY